MAKRFKLRISRVITSFHSCKSKDPSNLPQDPVPSFFRLPSVEPNLLAVDFSLNPPPSKPHQHRSSFKRHVSSAFISLGRSFTSKAGATKELDNDRTGSPQFKWQKEEKWHVVANIYNETPRRKIHNSSASGEDVLASPPPPPPPPHTAEKKKRRVKKKKTASRLRISNSSADSVWFSSDEKTEEETETLVSSSRSFTTDSSSEFNPHLETIREAPPISRRHNKKSKKKLTKTAKQRSKRNVSYPDDHNKQRPSVSSTENETPARLSVFKKLIPCSVDGKVKESFAIVKKSEEPYEDFKRSMMEMILEKEMFEKDDLEQLLQCFLSLNSRDYHGMIVEAFTEIWKALFSVSSVDHQEGHVSSSAA